METNAHQGSPTKVFDVLRVSHPVYPRGENALNPAFRPQGNRKNAETFTMNSQYLFVATYSLFITPSTP
jgi:hypothetical protein